MFSVLIQYSHLFTTLFSVSLTTNPRNVFRTTNEAIKRQVQEQFQFSVINYIPHVWRYTLNFSRKVHASLFRHYPLPTISWLPLFSFRSPALPFALRSPVPPSLSNCCRNPNFVYHTINRRLPPGGWELHLLYSPYQTRNFSLKI